MDPEALALSVLVSVAYLLLGVFISAVLAWLVSGRTVAGLEAAFPDTCIGAFGSIISYLFSTSVWADFAARRRLLGEASQDSVTAALLILHDRPILCAVSAAIAFSLTSRIGRVAVNKMKSNGS